MNTDMPDEKKEKSPSTQTYVKCKAMHANIEAIEYLLKDVSRQIKKSHEYILHNKDNAAIGELHDFERNLDTMRSLYQATAQLHRTHFNS